MTHKFTWAAVYKSVESH